MGACSSSFTQTAESAADPTSEASVPVVEAVQARTGALPLSERLNGTVIAQNQVSLYPEISGRIVRVLARNGDLVRAGDALAVLDDSQIREQMRQAEAGVKVNQAALSQARARYRELEVAYRRTAALAEEGLSSQLEVDTLQAQLDSARANIELAEAQIQESESVIEETRTILSKTVVRAPITGTVGRRNAEVGMQVSTNSQLFTIGDLQELRVEVVLNSAALANVQVGQTVKVYTGGKRDSARVVTSRLSRISPFLDPATRSTEAEVDIRNEGNLLRPGMSVSVEILYGESRQATLVPASAVYTHPTTGAEGVYHIPSFEPGPLPGGEGPASESSVSPSMKAEFRPIDVLAEGRMEVGVEGLDPKSWVVTVGQNLLAEGRDQARVRPMSWDRVMELQNLQREDLLQEVLRRE
jgi:RND family efflux transporter MFP subunit